MNLYDKSSLILVPGAVKDGKVYSQRSENGDGDFTFTRGSAATRVNENGLIESAGSNEPRLDYSGGASCPSLLLEPQRTNAYISSEYISNINFRLTQTISNIDSCILGVKFLKIERNQTGIARLTLLGSSNGDIDTFSVFAKKGSLGGNILQFCDNFYGSSTINVKFDLSIGDWESTPSGTALIDYGYEDFGNGIYRIWASGISYDISNPDSTKWRNPAIFLDPLGVNEYIYLTGIQAEKNSSYPTSYIPTYGSAVTRLKSFNSYNDIVDTPISFGANDDFTFFYEGQFKDFDSMICGGGNAGGGNDYRNYIWITPGTLRIRGYGEVQMGNASHSISKNTNTKILAKRNGSVITFFVNGVKLTTTTQTFPNSAFTFRSFGWSYNPNAYTVYGSAKQFIIFSTALTDSECIALTTL